MKFALVNPNWTFDGSIYSSCREAHLPLEFGYAKALLEQAGHEVLMVDGKLLDLSRGEIRTRVSLFQPDYTVVSTAPTYLFWRCAQPELRVSQQTVADLRDAGGAMVAVGPHGSATPAVALRKLGVDAVVLGECEEVLPRLAGSWTDVPGLCYWNGSDATVQGRPASADLSRLPALRWPRETIQFHTHHHGRFGQAPSKPAGEMETARSGPYYWTAGGATGRNRPVSVVLEELDHMLAQGVEYIYFVDQVFLPNLEFLTALEERPVEFGIQTRLDLWSPDALARLGRAGCVSMEADAGGGPYRPDELADRLVCAKKHVPFVQANLAQVNQEDPEGVEDWMRYLHHFGIGTNKLVPLFPYPGSPEYARRWGFPDDEAWERAHSHYLDILGEYGGVHEQAPLPLAELEFRDHRQPASTAVRRFASQAA